VRPSKGSSPSPARVTGPSDTSTCPVRSRCGQSGGESGRYGMRARGGRERMARNEKRGQKQARAADQRSCRGRRTSVVSARSRAGKAGTKRRRRFRPHGLLSRSSCPPARPTNRPMHHRASDTSGTPPSDRILTQHPETRTPAPGPDACSPRRLGPPALFGSGAPVSLSTPTFTGCPRGYQACVQSQRGSSIGAPPST